MANIWDEEAVSEYDLIAEDAQKAQELAEEYDEETPSVVEADDEVLEEISEESAFELNSSESNVIYNARLRLEQAKLYEMLINHNLFEGVEASPEAIQNVQNELKFYIIKRLERLLGISQPPVVRVESGATIELPFNDIELEFLKALAYKGTLGASATGKPVAPRVEAQVIRPVTPTQPKAKLKSLAPIPKKVAPPPVAQQPKAQPPKQAPVKKASALQIQQTVKQQPVRKAQSSKKVELKSGVVERKLTPAEIEALAKEDLKNMPAKPFHEMNAKEKAKRIKEVNEKYSRTSAKGALPIPSANELEMKYLNQQTSRGYSKNQTDQFNAILANALAAQKNRGDED